MLHTEPANNKKPNPISMSEMEKTITEIFKLNKKAKRKGFILMPDIKGFKVYEIEEDDLRIALSQLHALHEYRRLHDIEQTG